jgi:hypothetical protein
VNRDPDYLIIGAGFYGLYSALVLAKLGAKVVVLERDAAPFTRASYINQARVHVGYHYPRSLYTARKTASYFRRFTRDFGFCIKSDFKKIYAISSSFSFSGPKQFERFCASAQIPYSPARIEEYFNPQYIQGAYETTEYTYDAQMLCEHLLQQIKGYTGQVEILTETLAEQVAEVDGAFEILLSDGSILRTDRVLNATYASLNQTNDLFGARKVPIKYELCEVILCRTNQRLADMGITVLDGPFFSIMPFGHTGFHSLTSVTFTPHLTSYSTLPSFTCQKNRDDCSPDSLNNCNNCPAKPASAWAYMSQLAQKYLRDDLEFSYAESLFSVKPILLASEIDDSRPTVVLKHRDQPLFRSVLSGKINTVYDIKPDLLDDFGQ